FHQRVLGNRHTPLLHEHAQQCDGPVAQRNGLAVTEQCVRLRIKAERTEDVRCGHLQQSALAEGPESSAASWLARRVWVYERGEREDAAPLLDRGVPPALAQVSVCEGK